MGIVPGAVNPTPGSRSLFVADLEPTEMDDRVPRLRIGPLLFLRQIEPGRLSDRWLATHEVDDTTHVVHRFPVAKDRAEQRRFVTALETVSELDHPHILPIEQFTLGASTGGNGWVVTPFTGNQDGLLTLERLLAEKGGRMAPGEAERALIQVLEASSYAHDRGIVHGPLDTNEVLVDRRGSIAVELYGLGRALGVTGIQGGARAEVIRDEVESIVELGYRLITGLPADEPRIRISRLVRKLNRSLDDWFDAGLDPAGGFESAREALAALPSSVREVAEVKPSPVRVVLSRFARALRSK